MTSLVKKLVITLLALCFLGGQVATAQAAMINTWELTKSQQLTDQRAQLQAQLDREEVQNKLIELGASPALIQERIDNLTLSELQQLNDQIDTLPAGGFIGVLLVIFIVFVITDAVGATDVFTFVDPVN
jgi:hypothetical protein